MKLDDLVRDARAEEPKPDWQAIDAKLFERIEAERVPAARAPKIAAKIAGRAPVALFLAAAAVAALLIHPPSDAKPVSSASPASGVTSSHIEARENLYFEATGATGHRAVSWKAAAGSVLSIEHESAPLVLSLEQGSAEAQVTPVTSGEAFAVDITASSGNVVRVAVHGTHLRVARDGDQVVIDLTEGVVSIGTPPRRGSLIGTLVTAPAHVSLDARDIASMRVEHEVAAIRPAEGVTRPHDDGQQAALTPVVRLPSFEIEGVVPKPQQPVKPLTAPSAPPPVVDTWIRTPSEVISAIQACARVAPNAVFSTSLTMHIGDDGLVQLQPVPRFDPPLLPEARDCATNVIYKRVKMSTPGDVTIAIEIKP